MIAAEFSVFPTAQLMSFFQHYETSNVYLRISLPDPLLWTPFLGFLNSKVASYF